MLVGFVVWSWSGIVFGFILPDEPEEAFGCGVLAGLELVADEILQSVGFEGSGELAVLDFLSRRSCVNLVIPSNTLYSKFSVIEVFPTLMLPCMSLLTGLKAAPPITSKRVVRDSEASRNCVVLIALSLAVS